MVSSAKVACDLPHSAAESEIYKSITPLILFGRLFLLIPCGRSSHSTYKNCKLRLQLLPVVACSLVLCLGVFATLFDIRHLLSAMTSMKKSTNSSNSKTGGGPDPIMIYARHIYTLLNSLMSLVTLAFFLKNSDNFYKLLKTWTDVHRKFNLDWNKRLIYVSFASVAFMTIRVILYIVYIIDIFYYRLDGEKIAFSPTVVNMTFLQKYYNAVMQSRQDVIPNYDIFIVIHLFHDAIKIFPMFFVPHLIIFFSRATAFQLKRLVESATNSCNSETCMIQLDSKDTKFWEDFAAQFRIIHFLLKATNTFLSPLVFVFAVESVNQICIPLLELLNGRHGGSSPFMFFIWFTSAIIQFLGTLMNATKIPTNALKILDILEKCPEVHYTTQVARLENRVASGHAIAFTGLGYFSITNAFLLNIVGVIFSIEIILLQSMIQPTGR
ncbi:unnamed protein product [Orchesella dallaii]|uniref:Gustatory receptor n=1 Tax=Orchesella dallaii TaxID=48710 RepID=A0ABP1RWH8_9HEXA